MVELFLLFSSVPVIEYENSLILEKNDEPLTPGNYYVVGSSIGEFEVSDEPVLTRTLSLATGASFKAIYR
ncbi:MAG: hypothetical protein Q9163_005222 [Psora crenata]